MSRMKGMLLGMMAFAVAMEANDPTGAAQRFREDEERSKAQKKPNPVKQAKNRGLTEFHYEKGSVWASNQKVADKKAKKRNLI